MGCVLPRYFYVLTWRINEKRMSNDIEEFEYDGPRDKTITLSKHEVVLDRDAAEDIWEVAFGADAFEKGYTDQEVLKVLRSFSDKALKLDKALQALKAVVNGLTTQGMIDTQVRNLLDGCERVIQEIEA